MGGWTAQVSPRTPPVPFDASTVMPDKVPYASPAVRLFARELGVDLHRIEGSERKGRGAVAAAQVGAYLLYIISQYIVLWFSRTREYYADRFAGQATGNPNALARALVKIAYGLAGQNLAATGQGRAEAFADEAQQDLKDVPVPAARQQFLPARPAMRLPRFSQQELLRICGAMVGPASNKENGW